MARWKLLKPHYLNVAGTQYELKETDRFGKVARKLFNVPRYLDPDSPADWTHRYGQDVGDVIVCLPGRGQRNDVEFAGAPTPDMEPLDDEAAEISGRFAKRWGLEAAELFVGDGEHVAYGDRVAAELETQQSAVATAQPTASPDVAELKKLVESLALQNATMAAEIAELKAIQAPAEAAE